MLGLMLYNIFPIRFMKLTCNDNKCSNNDGIKFFQENSSTGLSLPEGETADFIDISGILMGQEYRQLQRYFQNDSYFF